MPLLYRCSGTLLLAAARSACHVDKVLGALCVSARTVMCTGESGAAGVRRGGRAGSEPSSGSTSGAHELRRRSRGGHAGHRAGRRGLSGETPVEAQTAEYLAARRAQGAAHEHFPHVMCTDFRSQIFLVTLAAWQLP